MKRHVPTVAELVRRAVEVCDPDNRDPMLGRFEECFEDDDEPITAVQDLEERLASAGQDIDPAIENPTVSMVTAVVLYLADSKHASNHDAESEELFRHAALLQWHGHPPDAVADWLADRGV